MSKPGILARIFKWLPVFLAIWGLLLEPVALVAAEPAVPADLRARIDPTLLHNLLQAPADQLFPVLVTMKEQADLAAVPPTADRRTRTAVVVDQLQATARDAQAAYLPALLALQRQEHVETWRSFWIFNGAAVTADRTAILELAARPDVALIRPDSRQQWLEPAEVALATRAPESVDWGIARIRADLVWPALGIDGAGVVVASMDSGVDWLHPDLQPAYRGWVADSAVHTGNWQDFTDDASPTPVDPMGHGTHVMGLMVGQDGLGVAPGAHWITARIFDEVGSTMESWVHAGFEWLLAPGGDPALAPDIVNNSWSIPDAYVLIFENDVRALKKAGILAVFSAGNNGPDAGSIGSPASYPDALAVAATDADDEVAIFSSRGPSPLAPYKPELAAPGVNLLSSLPGATYGEASGTSMAAPLVAGLAALVHQADPALSWAQVTHVMTSTAVHLGSSWPNYDTGWGRIDALAAVAAAADSGYLAGVARAQGGDVLAGVTVQASRPDGAPAASTQSDAAGAWRLALAPGTYDLRADRFGYEPALVPGLEVVTGTVTEQDLALVPLPTGLVKGNVVEAGTGLGIPGALVRVSGAPVQVLASPSGKFTLSLPADTYELAAEAAGYRIGRAPVTVTVGAMADLTLALEPAPTVLLVDSGAWYYGSEIDYYQAALDDNDYVYDTWTIKHPLDQTPVVTDLLPYGVVIWSSPFDSPGYLAAGDDVSDYMSAGGNLLVSGQDVGYWDSGANGFIWSPYFRDQLMARFVRDNVAGRTLVGTAGNTLDALTLPLNGPDSARNQQYPDGVSLVDAKYAESWLSYDSGELGAIAASTCQPHRSVYLAFGLEAAGNRSLRADVMGRALEWFPSPRQAAGLALEPQDAWPVGLPGTVVTHTVQIYNLGEAGTGDTYRIKLTDSDWPMTVISPTVDLLPCASTLLDIRVEIPAGLGYDVVNEVILSVRSTVSPTLLLTVPLITKTPAPVLLVDDDRWYPQEAAYRTALDASGIGYDYWDAEGGATGSRGTPAADTLAMYPLVVWFTGYDWYAPLTRREVESLETYLAAGGRLFLSSQDALYYQSNSNLARTYLGVQTHAEDMAPILAYGGDGRLGIAGRYELTYPFQNFSDGVIPAGTAVAEWYADGNQAVGLSHRGADWKTVFLAFPFEVLPAASRPSLLGRSVGWLGWLGSSELAASARDVAPGETVVFTATLLNDGPQPATVTYDNPLPAGLSLQPGSVSGAALAGNALSWQGVLAPGATHIVRYAGAVGQTLTSTATIAYAEHDLAFQRPVTVWVNAPDLSLSSLSARPAPLGLGEPVTWTLLLFNNGLAATLPIATYWYLPDNMTVFTDTLSATAGSLTLDESVVRWEGQLAMGSVVTVTVLAQGDSSARPVWYPSVAIVDDGATVPLPRAFWLEQRPLSFYLPVLMRAGG